MFSRAYRAAALAAPRPRRRHRHRRAGHRRRARRAPHGRRRGDIDPVSVATARANARANQRRRLRAPGARPQAYRASDAARPRAPYDLIFANILARPLQAPRASTSAGPARDPAATSSCPACWPAMCPAFSRPTARRRRSPWSRGSTSRVGRPSASRVPHARDHSAASSLQPRQKRAQTLGSPTLRMPAMSNAQMKPAIDRARRPAICSTRDDDARLPARAAASSAAAHGTPVPRTASAIGRASAAIAASTAPAITDSVASGGDERARLRQRQCRSHRPPRGRTPRQAACIGERTAGKRRHDERRRPLGDLEDRVQPVQNQREKANSPGIISVSRSPNGPRYCTGTINCWIEGSTSQMPVHAGRIMAITTDMLLAICARAAPTP